MNHVEDLLRRVEALEERDGYVDALDITVSACTAHPDEPVFWDTRGDLALKCGRADEAAAAFEQLLRLEPDAGDAWFGLGEAHQWQGHHAAAESCFARAAALDHERYVVPIRVTPKRFDDLVGGVLRTLPANIVDFLERSGTSVSAMPHPARDLVVEDHLDPHALGYWRGNPFGVSDSSLDGLSPGAAVEIYQLNIENWCADEARLREEVRRTVLHEIGHAVGMDHDLLDEDGY